MKGLTVMYEYKAKKWGILCSLLGIIAVVAERLHPFVVFEKFTAAQHLAMAQWFAFFGLFIIIFSKEKYDDDRAKAIRLKSILIAFMMETSLVLSIAMVGSLSADMKMIDSGILFMFAGAGIFTYLLTFYTGIYFDEHWEYEDKTLWQNLSGIGRNKWGMLIYLAIGVIVLILISLLGIVTD